MKGKKKRLKFKIKKINHEFTGRQITKYADPSPIMQYIAKLNDITDKK